MNLRFTIYPSSVAGRPGCRCCGGCRPRRVDDLGFRNRVRDVCGRDSASALERKPSSRSDALKVAVDFSPRTLGERGSRRGATPEAHGGGAFNRRSATGNLLTAPFRGLKSTATVTASLREAPVGASLRSSPPRGVIGDTHLSVGPSRSEGGKK